MGSDRNEGQVPSVAQVDNVLSGRIEQRRSLASREKLLAWKDPAAPFPEACPLRGSLEVELEQRQQPR